jgi:sec-independent protein translocase protein TatB
MGMPPPIEQASLGMSDSLFLMILALVVFGPRRLPQIGRQIGKLMYEFRKASNDFKFQMEEELRSAEEADRRKREEAERKQRLALAAQTQPAETKTDSPPAQTEGPTPEPAASSSTAEDAQTPGEESSPRILPPSTGETVAAARPGRAATQEPEGDVSRNDAPAEHDGTADDSRALTEQASRNG